jgi:hypothetical protein
VTSRLFTDELETETSCGRFLTAKSVSFRRIVLLRLSFPPWADFGTAVFNEMISHLLLNFSM